MQTQEIAQKVSVLVSLVGRDSGQKCNAPEIPSINTRNLEAIVKNDKNMQLDLKLRGYLMTKTNRFVCDTKQTGKNFANQTGKGVNSINLKNKLSVTNH